MDDAALPVPDPELLASSARYRAGWERLVELNRSSRARVVEQVARASPTVARQIVEFGYGDCYDTATLAARDRQLLTIAALASLGSCDDQLAVHLRVALNAGLDHDQLAAALAHLVPFVGFPRVINALGVLASSSR